MLALLLLMGAEAPERGFVFLLFFFLTCNISTLFASCADGGAEGKEKACEENMVELFLT